MLKKDLDPSDPRYFRSEGAELNLSGCIMSDDEFEKILVPFLKTHPEIKILDLSNMKIETFSVFSFSVSSFSINQTLKAFKALVTALPPSLTELYLDEMEGAALIEEEILVLVAVLPQTISVLELGGSYIGTQGVRALAKALSSNLTKLTLRRLPREFMSVEDIEVLAEALNKARYLTDLTLTGFNIGFDKGAKAIGKALTDKSKLAKLDLSGSDIGSRSAAIAEAIADKQNLTALNLESNNQSKFDDAETIVKLLVDKPNLTVLHLGWNRLGIAGAKFIASALVKIPHLASLDLCANFLGDESVKIICRSLVDKSNLQHLNLARNCISGVGANEIGKMLANQSDLINFDLQADNVNDKAIKTICNTPTNKPNFSELNVAHNKIGDTGAVALSKAISDMQNFSKLYFQDNEIGDQGAEAICEALVGKEKIEEFNCGDNFFSDRSVEMLASVLATHSSFPWKRNGGIVCLKGRLLQLSSEESVRYENLGYHCFRMFWADPVTRANFARQKPIEKKEIPDSTEQSSGVSITKSGSSVAKVKTFLTLVPSLRNITVFAIQRVLKKRQNAALPPEEKNLRAKLLPTQEELQDLLWLEEDRIREAKLRAVLPGDDLVKAFLPKM